MIGQTKHNEFDGIYKYDHSHTQLSKRKNPRTRYYQILRHIISCLWTCYKNVHARRANHTFGDFFCACDNHKHNILKFRI